MLVAAPADVRPALLAMAEMLCAGLDAPVHAPAAEVVVHVDLPTLLDATRADTPVPRNRFGKPLLRRPAAPDPDPPATAAGPAARSRRPARLDDGPPLAESVLRRLACDGRLQLSVDGVDGRTLDVGRRRRRPTGRQLAALWRRDRGCIVPGCGRVRFLHAHHVLAWSQGGRTSMDNLVLLCGEHHRGLHEGAIAVVALGRQTFRCHGPGGAAIAPAPETRGSVADLVADHPRIDGSTLQTDWDGAPLDLPWATSAYLENWLAAS